jgi:hypothetical protein
VRQVASPRVKETPVRAQPYEAGATWGAPVEAKPQDSEIRVVTVTPGSQAVEVATFTNIFDVAEHVLNTALEKIAIIELASLPWAESTVKASRVDPIRKGLFYEIVVTYEDGWVERQVVRADKVLYYKKETLLYFENAIILVELHAVYKNRTLYYAVYVIGDWVAAIGYELEGLLEREGEP